MSRLIYIVYTNVYGIGDSIEDGDKSVHLEHL